MNVVMQTHLCLGGGLLASPLKLLVTGQNHDLRLLRPIAQLEQHFGRCEHSCMAATHWINDLHFQC